MPQESDKKYTQEIFRKLKEKVLDNSCLEFTVKFDFMSIKRIL